MDTTPPPARAWTHALQTEGRLELVPARWPWAMLAIAAVMAVLAGIGMYGDAGDNEVQRVIGIIVMIGGIIGIPMAIRTYRRGKEPIVIDGQGIRLPSRPLIPWHEVQGTDVFANQGSFSPMIVVSDAFRVQFHRNTNPMVRLFSVVNRGVSRTPAIYLPTTLRHNGTRIHPYLFAAWLAVAAKHYGGGT